MTVDFNDYFWGEKNNGFDVLYHNMKFGLVASKELSEFFREKSNIEEQNSKLMSKLAHKASTGTLNSTFAPVWTILRTSAEKVSTLHLQMVQKLSELVKDVAKYADELHKKHKTVKEEESQTLECVQAMQASTAAVQKSRDIYSNKVQELEKLKRENASQKEIEKVESKLKKFQEDYKALLDKHNPIKNEFERRMTQTCKRFQEIEEVHLRQMKEFLSTYLELLQNNHDMVGQVHSDFKRQFVDMTVDKLLEQFVLNKYTGLEKPEMPDLDFVPLTLQQLQSSSATRLNQPSTASITSVATNSNSATSIQGGGGGGAPLERRGVSGDIASLVSGASGSLLNVNDIGTPPPPVSAGSARPTSPELNATATASDKQNTTTATVKSNFLKLFSSSVPNKQQQQQQQQQQSVNASSTAQTGGNFGMAINGASSGHSTINTTTTTTNTTTNNTTTTTTTIMKNSFNSEQDNININQGSFMSSALTQLSEQSNSTTTNPNKKQTTTSNTTTSSTTSSSTSMPKSFKPPATTATVDLHQHPPRNRHEGIASSTSSITTKITSPSPSSGPDQLTSALHSHPQPQIPQPEKQHDTSASNAGASAAGPYQRRTASLLNIFTSNSQVSGILRSRRDKAKTKKSKKKKDGETGGNIQEERLASSDRSGPSALDHDHEAKLKSQISSGSSAAGGLPSSLGSAPGSMDSNSAAGAAGSGGAAVGNGAVLAAAGSLGASTSGAEVDEDGYSIQPPKETAWEESHNNTGSFYSDSDSDSDNDKPERRIHVKIKPLNNGQAPMSASVDELRATVENISLSPTGGFSQHSQQLQQSRIPSRQQSPEISNASTPTASVHPYAPLQSPTLSMTNNSRYADLGDIFSELGEVSVSAPTSATLAKSNSRQIPTPTSGGSIAIPRPPSRRSEMITGTGMAAAATAAGRGRMSPSPMNRADSIGSLEFRTAIGGIGSSRGPSPLTIGITDTIPLAVAFHEIIHAYFRGSDESRCQVKISGDMMLSFPAGIAGLLANNPNPAKLGFRIKNIQNLENLVPNSKLVQIDKNQSSSFSAVLEFNMAALTALLRRQAEHNPTAAYFNVDILKYQVRTRPGAQSCPFQLVSYWKCEQTFTALKIDYKYNNHSMANASPLLNVTMSVPVNGSVRNVQSKPHSAWLGESNRLVWNFTDISQNSQDGGVGTLRARLELNEGPSTPAILSTQFNCEGTTLSGIEFELQGAGYRLSLVKRRFVSGKYVCEGDGIRSGATPTPPSVGSSSPYSAKST